MGVQFSKILGQFTGGSLKSDHWRWVFSAGEHVLIVFNFLLFLIHLV